MKLDLFSLTKANQNFVNLILNSGVGRDKCVSVALAKALSDTYVIAPMDIRFEEYFDTTFKDNALIVLNDINETMLIDIDATLHYIEKFLELRYSALCGADKNYPFVVLGPKNAFLSLIGVLGIFTPDEIEYINNDYMKINEYINRFIPLIEEINQTGE